PGAVLHHAGRRRGGRRGHRPHGPRAVHGVPAAGAPPARMTPAAAPLAELLRALAPPLEYLAADDFRRLDQIRLPLPALAANLARLGLATVEDLLYHLPVRHEHRRALQPLGQLHVGEEATAVGEVARVREARAGRRGRHVLEVVLRDGDGLLLLVWFHQIPYFSRRLREGQRLVVHGRVEPPLGGGPRRIIHPEMEILGADEDPAALPRIVPVYEKPTAMHPGAMRRIAQAAVEEFAERVPSALPPAVAARQRVVDVPQQLRHMHTPAPEADLQALGEARSLAHRSPIFDELFFLQLGL